MELKATLFSKQREVKSQGKKNASGNDGTALSTNAVSEKVSFKRPRSIEKKQALTFPICSRDYRRRRYGAGRRSRSGGEGEEGVLERLPGRGPPSEVPRKKQNWKDRGRLTFYP